MSDQKENPERLALRAAPKPVRRLNRTALAVGVSVVSLGLLGVTMGSLHPAAHRRDDPPPVSSKAQPVPKAEGLEQLPKDYSGLPSTIPALGPPFDEPGRPLDGRRGVSPKPPEVGPGLDDGENDEHSHRTHRSPDTEAAAKAQVFFPLSRRQPQVPAEAASPPAESPFNQALKLLPSALGGDITNPASNLEDGSAQNGQRGKRSFIAGERSNARNSDGDIYAKGELQMPRSPYEVMAGTVIPAALVTGINSDLPGQIIATVTENVYDTVTGRFLLVPQGSRLLGQYDSDVSFGQSRVLLVWTRLIRPDGSSITLDRLPGVDANGNAGLQDGVDYHWRRIFAGAAASTLLGIGSELAAPNRAEGRNSVVISARSSVQDTINDAGQQITRRNLNVQPTLTIRAGFPVRVIVQKDLILNPFNNPRAARAAEEYP